MWTVKIDDVQCIHTTDVSIKQKIPEVHSIQVWLMVYRMYNNNVMFLKFLCIVYNFTKNELYIYIYIR